MTSEKPPVFRATARVLVIDAADRILLLQHQLDTSPTGTIWVAPGGGLQAGESYEVGARRELEEETGLREFELSPCVWVRSLLLTFQGVTYDARERYFVCRVDSLDIASHLNPDEWERGQVVSHAWWTAGEVEASSEYFAPRALGKLVRPLIEGEYPAQPIEMGA